MCIRDRPCPALKVDHSEYLDMLRKIRSIKNVKRVFIRSGIRYDYMMKDKNDEFFKELVEHHVSGQLKVAPEHASNKVLDLMGKPHICLLYTSFNRRTACGKCKKELYRAVCNNDHPPCQNERTSSRHTADAVIF